jgi:hypothetical protein
VKQTADDRAMHFGGWTACQQTQAKNKQALTTFCSETVSTFVCFFIVSCVCRMQWWERSGDDLLIEVLMHQPNNGADSNGSLSVHLLKNI